MGKIVGLWWAYLRRIDIHTLWPICKHQAASLGEAREAFLLHALNDSAWIPLGPEKTAEIINKLT